MNRQQTYLLGTVLACLMSATLPQQAQGQAELKEKTTLTSTTPVSRNDDWWMPRHQEKLADKDARKDKIQLVMIGDSITHAWEDKGVELWAKHYAPHGALNLGYSGDRTEHVLWRLQHGEIEGLSPRVVVLLIGTNNAGHREEPSDETAAGIRAILDELRERLPEAKVLLLAIFPRDMQPDGKYRQLTDGTNAIIKSYADDDHIFYLDVADSFLDDDGNLLESVMPDQLHPSLAGYELWVAAMQPALDALMSQGETQ